MAYRPAPVDGTQLQSPPLGHGRLLVFLPRSAAVYPYQDYVTVSSDCLDHISHRTAKPLVDLLFPPDECY
jgi:hypothetical protein